MKFESRDPLKIALENAGQKTRSYFWVEFKDLAYSIHLRSDDMQRKYEVRVTRSAIESAMKEMALDSIVRHAIGVMKKSEEKHAS